MKIILSENQKNRLATKWLNSNYGDCKKYILKNERAPFRIFFKKNNRIVMILKMERNPIVYFGKEISDGIKQFNMDFYEVLDFLLNWFQKNYYGSTKLSVPNVDLGDFEKIYSDEDFSEIEDDI